MLNHTPAAVLLQRISSDMDALWRMQIITETGAKRDLWKSKVEQVAEETDALRAGLERFSGRERRCVVGGMLLLLQWHGANVHVAVHGHCSGPDLYALGQLELNGERVGRQQPAKCRCAISQATFLVPTPLLQTASRGAAAAGAARPSCGGRRRAV